MATSGRLLPVATDSYEALAAGRSLGVRLSIRMQVEVNPDTNAGSGGAGSNSHVGATTPLRRDGRSALQYLGIRPTPAGFG